MKTCLHSKIFIIFDKKKIKIKIKKLSKKLKFFLAFCFWKFGIPY